MKPRYLFACSAGELAAMETEALVRTLVRRAREVYQVVVSDPEKQSWARQYQDGR
ncbi:hypothetical protein GCM10009555_091810 [Acrocarpospora macrocephala]|uniref:Uncharacterized protein n=1 Tax=Acrocarpospora macrocephala TaxID=150177 RepID=A0A5M3X6X1_9ACTN|nr:hypothetical protein [Acrocarpospora macrocephala]GES16820.1 hypothetical protein Amac_104180 [Acrocarpospora macrocephala]